MSDMISDSESRKASRCRKNSPSDETSSGGNSCGGGPLKKGPWTSAEDAILVEYVTEHGEGNWNAVQKHSGLARCGKSCRLRWTNHLRPNLKKGAFTPEEEARIIELHAKMGNKWARMAAELPGRTDNEIKNFWNTRIKRLHRLGQPIYPPEIRMRANESQQSEDPGNGRKGERHHSGVPQANVLAIPNVEFKSLEFSQGLLTCPPHLLDIPTSNLLHRGASSSHTFGFALPTMNPQKHFCDMENQFQAPFTSTSDALSLFDPREDDAFLSPPHSDSLWLPSSFDPDPNVNHPLIIDFPGSHAPINGNSSSSKPVSVAVKPEELPSLQYPASQGGTWAPYGSRIPALVSVDSSIQSPFNEQAQSNCASPRNSGLLEAIVYESHSLSSSKNNSYPYMSEASAMAGDVVDSLSQNVHETKWEAYGDLGSPLSQTAASVFVDYPPIGGTSGDEPHFAEPVPGCKIKQEKAESESPETDGERDGSTELDFIRPDTLLDSLWFSHGPVCYKKLCITADIEPFLGDDTSFQYPQAGSLALDSNQSFSPESSAWVDTCLITKSH